MNDCQGKKDYDGNILSISTRYWPAGGGLAVIIPGRGLVENPFDCKPSARSSLILHYSDDEYITLTESEFEGETFEDVSKQVELWAQMQMNAVVELLKREFIAIEQPNKA